MTRLARTVVALAFASLAAVVGVAAVQPPAMAWDVPKPVVLSPGSGGTLTKTGPATTVGPTGTVKTGPATILGLALAGKGAYDGTCWVLGQMFKGGSCGEFTVFGLTFGDAGDQRSAAAGITYSGTPAVCPGPGYTIGCVVNYGFGVYKHSVGGLLTCQNAAGTLSATYWYMVNWDATSNFNSNAAVCSAGAPGGSTAPYDAPGTLYGYPVAAGRSAYTICGGTCDRPVKIEFYQDFLNSSTGAALGTMPAPKQIWYLPNAQPWTVDYTKRCENGATVMDVSDSVHFTPTPNMVAPEPTLPDCGTVLPGSHTKSLKVEGGRDTIENPEVTIVQPTATPAAEATYPLCTTSAPSTGCWLDLQKDGKSCFGPNVYCAGWTQNITRWKMTCEWGPYSVAISECQTAYATKFDTQTQLDPNAEPTPGGGTGFPGSGENPVEPGVKPDTQTDPDSRSCYADAWSWNPIDWVYVPVKCVMIWAFVPDELPDWSALPDPIPPGWLPDFPDMGDVGCGPVTIGSLNFGGIMPATGTRELFDTCDQPWPQVRAVTYYGLLSLGLISAGFRGLRILMNGLGVGVDTVTAAERIGRD